MNRRAFFGTLASALVAARIQPEATRPLVMNPIINDDVLIASGGRGYLLTPSSLRELKEYSDRYAAAQFNYAYESHDRA